MRVTFLTLALSLCLAATAFVPQPPSTSGHSLIGRTLTAVPTLTPTQANSPEYYTSTNLITIPGETNAVVTRPGNTITIAIPTCSQTTIPDPNGYVPPGTCGALWNYYPSFGTAAAFTAIFVVLLVVHTCQAIAYRKKWCWVIITACAWEAIAMLFRTMSTKNQQSSWILMIFQIFILTAPLLINAHAYILLSRLLQAYHYHPGSSLPLSPHHPLITLLPPRTLSTIFILLDLAAFIVQLTGGSSATPTAPPQTRQRGIHIYMGGIAFQQAAILCFAAFCVVFVREMRRHDRLSNSNNDGAATTGDGRRRGCASLVRVEIYGWRPLMLSLILALAMITVRIVYRLVEFAGEGFSEPSKAIEALGTEEVWFYLLEAGPMVVALSGFAVWCPGRAMRGLDEAFPKGRGCSGCCGRGRGGRKGQERLGSQDGHEGQGVFGDRVLLVARKT